MEIKNSFNEIDIFINDYKKQMENFCERLGINREELLAFLQKRSKEIGNRIENIDNNVGRKKEFTEFNEIDEDEKYIFEALVGKKDIDYDNVDFSEIEEAQKKFNKLFLENEYAKSIVSQKSSEEIPENILPKVKAFFDEQKNHIEQLEKNDPDTTIKNFLIKKYPEIAEIIGDKLDTPDLYKKMDNLPNNISQNIRDILGEEYQKFVKEIQKKGENEQEKLTQNIKEYNKKYSKDIYETYKQFTDEEKEEFLKYSDREISDKVLSELKIDVENARENIKFSPIYNAYSNYCAKKEFVLWDENKIISNKIEDIISDKIDMELDKMAEIRGHVMPYFGKKKDLNVVNSSIINCNDLKQYISKTLKSSDIKKAFNNMSEKEISDLRERFLESNIDIRGVLSEVSTDIESSYKKEADICGDMILEMSNYENDNTFVSFLENAYDDQMREELLSIAKYRLDDQRGADQRIIRYARENEVRYSNKELDEIMEFCNFKYDSVELHLKDNASLANVKVKDSDEIGLRKFLNKADKIAEAQLKANKNIVQAKDERIKNQTMQAMRLRPKKVFIESTRENILNRKNIENEGLICGG